MRCVGFSLLWLLLSQSTGSRAQGTGVIVVAHGVCRLGALGGRGGTARSGITLESGPHRPSAAARLRLPPGDPRPRGPTPRLPGSASSSAGGSSRARGPRHHLPPPPRPRRRLPTAHPRRQPTQPPAPPRQPPPGTGTGRPLGSASGAGEGRAAAGQSRGAGRRNQRQRRARLGPRTHPLWIPGLGLHLPGDCELWGPRRCWGDPGFTVSSVSNP